MTLKINNLVGFAKGGAVAFDLDATAFFTATGITDAVQKSAVNTLVLALKAAGIWTKCNAIYPFVGGTATTHKYNLKDPQDTNGAFRITFAGTVTHDSNGITGNGTTGTGNTNLNASTTLTLNNTHMSIYSRSNISGNTFDMGTYTGATSSMAIVPRNGSTADMYIYSESTFIISFSNSDSRGMFLASRRASNDSEGYKNGVSQDTEAGAGGTLPNATIRIMSGLFSGSPTNHSARNLAFASIGSGLTDQEAADFYTAVQAYQTALSRQV